MDGEVVDVVAAGVAWGFEVGFEAEAELAVLVDPEVPGVAAAEGPAEGGIGVGVIGGIAGHEALGVLVDGDAGPAGEGGGLVHVGDGDGDVERVV